MSAPVTAAERAAVPPVPRPDPRVRRRSSKGLRRGDMVWGYILIAPTAIGLLALSIWPAIQTFWFSFTTCR